MNKFPDAPWTPDEKEHRRALARAVARLNRGERNSVGVVTLEVAPATTTVITDSRITPETLAILVPLHADAAAEVPTLFQTAAAGSITLTHAANASSDRTFGFVLVG